MDNIQKPVTPVDSGTTQANTQPSNDFQLAAGESVHDAFSRFADSRQSQKGSEVSQSPDELSDSVNPDSQELSQDGQSKDKKPESEKSPRKDEQKQDENPGVKKRIDSLTAKLKSEQSSRKELELKAAQLEKAVELYAKELERISSKAQLDPNEEKIRRLELERDIDRYEREIPETVNKKFAELDSQAALEERTMEIFSEMQEVSKEYDGLFSIQELATFMRTNDVMDPVLAGKQLSSKRLEAAGKRFKQPAAPSTSSSGNTDTREPATPWKYEGSNSILSYLNKQEKNRRGY